MHYYQHHIGDFIKDTNFLTNEEVGIYMKLIWLYYDTEKPLKNDIFALSMKTNARDSQQAVEGILDMFFILDGDHWHHTRCDKEIAEYADFCAKQKANGLKGGRPKVSQTKPRENPADSQIKPKETLTTNHYPLPTNQDKNIDPPDGVSVDLWKDFLVYRKRLKSPVTPRVLARLIKESELARMPLSEVLETIIFKGWKSFDASWVQTKAVASTDNEWRNNDGKMLAKANELGLHTVGLQRYEIINKIDATLRSRGL